MSADGRRGIGTYWVAKAWLRERLPRDARLPRAVVAAVDAFWAEGDAGVRPWQEEEDEDGGRTAWYPVTEDDVIGGSIVLVPMDEALFPWRPNPAWLEIRDELGGVHDGILLTRDGRRELFGLRGLLSEADGDGAALCLHATPDAHVFLAELRGAAAGSGGPARRDDSLARRLWRHLLRARDWRSIE